MDSKEGNLPSGGKDRQGPDVTHICRSFKQSWSLFYYQSLQGFKGTRSGVTGALKDPMNLLKWKDHFGVLLVTQ